MDKPVILQMGEYPAWDETPLNARFDMRRIFDATDADAFLAEHAPYARGIATRGELGASRAVIDACPKLEIVSVYGVGYDAVDLDACRARGIQVTNTPDVLSGDVADFAVAMMLAQSRGIVAGDGWVRNGDWTKRGAMPLQRRAFGRRAGILGLGRIGFEIAKRLSGFDMKISYTDVAPKHYAQDWTFVATPEELATQCDFLFVAAAASRETRHIVNGDVLAALGPDGMLINVSRASNVDEDALIAALSDGTLGAAALDVFEGEPALDERFLSVPNIMLQPHQASGTVETRKAMGALLRANLEAHFSGKPLISPVSEVAP
ncbi:2-hydroxyacid dehydrogenase [Nitratireductor basaltis]|uniref:D-isomer specific 2-hydroxyacid dehydrogenase NAD-binding protein n=1 Tax=Nitratireductor basaltis TaxID=472175 RepID=A0A084U5W3_9HYPH|nr:2-hydroxyacid dehydrogenase [Nitratireductor basaltis]KFB08349.1 D-isomer specific 2-hydroxyacid dehydrogenase NAD-binding protein [Nitratireductor basaltis]